MHELQILAVRACHPELYDEWAQWQRVYVKETCYRDEEHRSRHHAIRREIAELCGADVAEALRSHLIFAVYDEKKRNE